MVHGSEEDQAVAAGILAATQRAEGRARPDRKVVAELGRRSSDFAIVTAVQDQDDHPSSAKISGLEGDPPLCGLHVAESRLALDHRIHQWTVQRGICASEVARDRHRDLGAPSNRRMDARSEATEYGQARRITDRRRDRMDTQREFVPKDSGHSGEDIALYRWSGTAPALDTRR